jgi:hypothetical protein
VLIPATFFSDGEELPLLLVVHLSEIISLPTALTTPFSLTNILKKTMRNTNFNSFLYYLTFSIQFKSIKGSLLKVVVVGFSLRCTTSNGGSSYHSSQKQLAAKCPE